jgi:hypothetical protein
LVGEVLMKAEMLKGKSRFCGVKRRLSKTTGCKSRVIFWYCSVSVNAAFGMPGTKRRHLCSLQ